MTPEKPQSEPICIHALGVNVEIMHLLLHPNRFHSVVELKVHFSDIVFTNSCYSMLCKQ